MPFYRRAELGNWIFLFVSLPSDTEQDRVSPSVRVTGVRKSGQLSWEGSFQGLRKGQARCWESKPPKDHACSLRTCHQQAGEQ